MSDLPLFAYRAISRVLEKGLAQGHKQDAWKGQTELFHLMKGNSHSMTRLREIARVDDQSDEDHAELAFCRMAMALYVKQLEKGNDE